jgi:hypothetical protein
MVVIAGCGEVPGEIPPGAPEPVIQMLLLSGAPRQVASVEYSAPAESAVAVVARPIAAESVSLVIETPDNVSLPLQPVPGVPGRFVVDLTVEPLTMYRLVGTVVGRAIEADVTVPGPVIVDEPAGDTLRLSPAGGHELIPYAWHAAGAAAYLAWISDGMESWDGQVVHDTIGEVLISPRIVGHADTVALSVRAYESVAAAFFLAVSGARPRAGNIRGALGAFGAATLADPPKVIIWQ